MKKQADEQQDATVSVADAGETNGDIITLLEKHNPSQSPKVEKFLRAFYAGQSGTCLQILDEGELLINDKTYLEAEGDRMRKGLTEKLQKLYVNRIKELVVERDTYSQFYYSVLDVVAQTPSLMVFVKVQIQDFTKTMEKAARRPWTKPGSWGFVTNVLMGLVKILTKRKTRHLISEYLKKVDFKSPFLLMMNAENFPEKFHTLKPYIEKVHAVGQTYAKKREEWEISKMPGSTYEEKRGNWLAKKEADKAKQQQEQLNQAK